MASAIATLKLRPLFIGIQVCPLSVLLSSPQLFDNEVKC